MSYKAENSSYMDKVKDFFMMFSVPDIQEFINS